MAFEFKLPDLGEGIHEAQVLAWKVAPGQEVAAFQPLVEVESAKARAKAAERYRSFDAPQR